jgi:hypothetical protein
VARRIVGGLSVQGLEETIAAASAAEKDLKTVMLREIRRELNPIRDDIRKRFRELGGTGPRVATTVRSTVTAKSAMERMGNAKHPYSLGREFGAKRNRTRPFFRRVQSGAMASRKVGGGQRQVMTAAIPYSSPRIFDSWTGNQFDLGESGDRLRVTKTSGRAFYPAIGAGAQNVFERLGKVADKYAGSFPGPSGAGGSPVSGSSPAERLQGFLSGNGL